MDPNQNYRVVTFTLMKIVDNCVRSIVYFKSNTVTRYFLNVSNIIVVQKLTYLSYFTRTN